MEEVSTTTYPKVEGMGAYLLWITTKGSNVVLDEIQCHALVQKARVEVLRWLVGASQLVCH
jgi:hypothetical protein